MEIPMNPLARAVRLALLAATTSSAALTAAAADPTTVRFATFNASLNRDASGDLLSDLANPLASGAPTNVANRILQARNAAEILQRINADVLLVNEFDFDLNGVPTASSAAMPLGYSSQAAKLFQSSLLSA
jgi:3-phytase/alkaline phosphatase D